MPKPAPAYPEFAAAIARAGVRQEDLASAVGVARPVISKIVYGYVCPTEALRQRLAEALDVDDVEALFQLAPDIQYLIDRALEQGLTVTVSDSLVLHQIATMRAPRHPQPATT